MLQVNNAFLNNESKTLLLATAGVHAVTLGGDKSVKKRGRCSISDKSSTAIQPALPKEDNCSTDMTG